MSDIKIRVGAAVDTNMGATIFKPIVEGAKKARDEANKALGGIGKGGGRSGGGSPYRQSAEGGGVETVRRDNAAKKREHENYGEWLKRHNAKIGRDFERDRRTAERRAQHIADAGALRVSGGAVRAVGGMVRGAGGVAADLARGAGIDFSLGGALKSRMGLEKSAVDISNSGYMTKEQGGQGANLSRQDPKAIIKEAQQVAIATGNSTEDVMAGLSAFVAKTGDLATGRAILADMAKLATATGANLGDVVSAAGDVSTNLGDAKDKAAAVESIMRITAGQGKLGAVEMKDFSVQMAKVASRSGEYAGSTEATMASLGALVQTARAHGGAASASQAANSVSAFTNTFSKSARRKEFAAAGKQLNPNGVQIEDEQGQLLDPETIIRNSLKATGGDKNKMNKLFMDANAQRAVRGFQTAYTKAGGGKAGDDAVHKMFEEMRGAGMSKDQVGEQFNAAMGTGASKAAVLQEKIKKDLGDALEKAAPQLENLGKHAGDVIAVFAQLVAWAAGNPYQALGAMVSASMVKSLGGEMMRSGIERLIGNLGSRMAVSGAGAPQAGMLAGAGGALGAFQSALGIATVALAAYTAGVIAIDQAFKDREKKQNAVATSGATAEEAMGKLIAAKKRLKESEAAGVVSPQAQADVEAAETEARAALEKLKADKQTNDESAHGFGLGLARAGATIFGGDEGRQAIKTERETIDKQSDAMAVQIRELTSALTGGTLRVEVVNQPPGGAPPDGRTPR